MRHPKWDTYKVTMSLMPLAFAAAMTLSTDVISAKKNCIARSISTEVLETSSSRVDCRGAASPELIVVTVRARDIIEAPGQQSYMIA